MMSTDKQSQNKKNRQTKFLSEKSQSKDKDKSGVYVCAGYEYAKINENNLIRKNNRKHISHMVRENRLKCL